MKKIRNEGTIREAKRNKKRKNEGIKQIDEKTANFDHDNSLIYSPIRKYSTRNSMEN
jgi:hypothetical protein